MPWRCAPLLAALLAAAALRPSGALDNGIPLTPAMGWSRRGSALAFALSVCGGSAAPSFGPPRLRGTLVSGRRGCALRVRSLPARLAPTPRSWNSFRCNISHALIIEVADALVASGLAAAGYRYVNVDDCWMLKERDANGHLAVDKAKFPHGMRALGTELHKRGLKFGIYSAVRRACAACARARLALTHAQAGNRTCEGYAASWGHETMDAKDFASWGVDHVRTPLLLPRCARGPLCVALLRTAMPGVRAAALADACGV